MEEPIRFKLDIESKNDTIIETDELVLKSIIRRKYVRWDDNTYVLSKELFSKKMQVKNVCRYILSKDTDGRYEKICFNRRSKYARYSRYCERSLNYEKFLPTICLILESPHADEYLYDINKIKPIAPAQGCTGDRIDSFLADIINRNNILNLSENRYRVILVNPVPLQTSLFFLHGKKLQGCFKNFRNKIWKCLWQSKLGFRRRFGEIIRNRNMILINCCTSCLASEIEHELTSQLHYKAFHPAMWSESTVISKIEAV